MEIGINIIRKIHLTTVGKSRENTRITFEYRAICHVVLKNPIYPEIQPARREKLNIKPDEIFSLCRGIKI